MRCVYGRPLVRARGVYIDNTAVLRVAGVSGGRPAEGRKMIAGANIGFSGRR